ncbi:MAG: TM2 domain-containing protein [Planctomycetota bacterium]|nr:TM2 domain-containing protein [Planctomycetota bacterium]
MAVQVTCPQCGRVASLREVDQRKTIRCRACATVFDIARSPDQETDLSSRAQELLAQQAVDEQWVKGLWDVISTPMLILMRFIGKEQLLPAPPSGASPRPGPAAPAHPSTLSSCPVCGSAWPKDNSRCMNCHWDCIQARHIAPAMAPPIPSGLGLQAPVARPPDPQELSVCPSCGSPWRRFALQCTVCNWDPVRKRHVAPRREYASDDGSLDGGEKAAGCLLAFFLGFLGAHRFYLGHHNVGLSQLLIWFVNISIGAYALFYAPEWLFVTSVLEATAYGRATLRGSTDPACQIGSPSGKAPWDRRENHGQLAEFVPRAMGL